MGSSPDAKLGWGIDLGSEENWYEGEKYEALGRRFHGDEEDDLEGDGSFYDWCDNTLPNLYINKAARDAEFDALYAEFSAGPKSPEERDAYQVARQEIASRYPVPVERVTYGYEFGSAALVLSRSYSWASDWGSIAVDPASVAPPTEEEITHLRTAVEALGLTFDPTDVQFILMSQYG